MRTAAGMRVKQMRGAGARCAAYVLAILFGLFLLLTRGITVM